MCVRRRRNVPYVWEACHPHVVCVKRRRDAPYMYDSCYPHRLYVMRRRDVPYVCYTRVAWAECCLLCSCRAPALKLLLLE